MLVGHYAPAYLLRGRRPDVPLFAFFLAVQAPDILFFVLAPLGIEHLAIRPGVSGPLAMQLQYIPYSHSLVGVIALAAAVGLVASRVWHRAAGLALATAVVSHWLLDLVVHVPDLPLAPGVSTRVGFGLWQFTALSALVEVSLLVASAVWLARRLPASGSACRWLYGGAAVLAVVQVPYVMWPPPQTANGLGLEAELLYVGAALLAWMVDRQVKRSGSTGSRPRRTVQDL